MEKIFNDEVILLPSYEPNNDLIIFLNDLLEAGYNNIIVVDDGSLSKYQEVFNLANDMEGVHVIHHAVNQGKGRALKTGFNYILQHYPYKTVLTCDGDGQNTIEQVNKLKEAVNQSNSEFVLATRSFNNSKNVPILNFIGNKLTVLVFFLLTGIHFKDTQTGVRAFKPSMMKKLLIVEGERFEFENVMLLCVRKERIIFAETTIDAVYEKGNPSSHFNKVKDSARIYAKLLKFVTLPVISLLLGFIFCVILWNSCTIESFIQPTIIYGLGLLISWFIKCLFINKERYLQLFLIIPSTVLLCAIFYFLMHVFASFVGIWWLCAIITVPINYKLYLYLRYGKPPHKIIINEK